MKNRFSNTTKYIVIALFLVACVLSVVFMNKITINYNISDYLDENTETKISLEIIEDEFELTGNIQVLAENVDVDTAKSIRDKIKSVDNVLAVNFDEYSENYYKDGKALFVVLTNGDEYSQEANEVVSAIRTELSDLGDKISMGGNVVEKANLRSAIEGEIVYILVISLVLVAIIMLLTSKSWIEPIVLLAASGVAVLLNMGTNAFFGEISYITNAVAAILQLALSIDYSIVLLHQYRAVKAEESDSNKAMLKAIKQVLSPVSASALTTIAGLLALLFMSFRIGFDIGSVLMKGIVVSAITSLTLLPALLLVFDKLMNKTAKKSITLNGKGFCKFAFKGCKVIAPIALALIIVCGALQLGNTYSFTDSKNPNPAISDTFGTNNTVVVLYPNNVDSLEGETAFINKINFYKTSDGKPVLKSYTSYNNTVNELYDVELATRKLNLSKENAELLLTMYHLYNDNSLVELKPLDFLKYTDEFVNNDAEAKEFADEKTIKTVRTMLAIDEIMNGEHTAEKFVELASGIMGDAELGLFAVKQMYGLYFYDAIPEKAVDFEAMLDYILASSQKPELSGMFDENTVGNLAALSQGIKQFKAQMDKPLTKLEFQGYMYQTYGVMINDMTAAQLYAGYYYTVGQPEQESIPFLKLMSFLASQNQIPDPTAVATLNAYNTLYTTINASYTYEQFLPVLVNVATALSGTAPTINTNALALQQIYVMYFYEQNAIPTTAISGREFVEFVKQAITTNPIVSAQLSDVGKASLTDICVVDEFLNDDTAYDFKEMSDKLNALTENIQSMTASAALDADKISGIYVKYAIANELNLTDAIVGKDLLDFVESNMNDNVLLKGRMTDDIRAKIASAKADIASATDLFLGEKHSRLLLSIDLPSESEESSKFVEYLTATLRETLGSDAHVAGEIVSTHDLQESFSKDNTLISIFTIVSIFVIIMLVFRSLSLPVVLVTVIQGAIWISMSTSLITGPMFFMSYIVTTCILMGATIDYGILMSTNYVGLRQTFDKKQALYKSVEAAMPTVFTSGTILTVCGFIVGIIASQNSISQVGFLLGKGTLVSVIMITLVLPSVLYLLDGFILKLSMKKKK